MRQSEKGEIENQNGREIQRDNGMMMNGKLQGQLYPSQKEIKRKKTMDIRLCRRDNTPAYGDNGMKSKEMKQKASFILSIWKK